MVSLGKCDNQGAVEVTFSFNASVNSEVFLAGSFNDWDSNSTQMLLNNQTGNYELVLLLQPGYYEYKFIVNGNWILDETNPNFAANDFGTLNSVLNIE
jgi:1,4-alpha-glucan branching enzyme